MNLTDALNYEPYLLYLGLEIVTAEPLEVTLRLPLRREVSNHLGLAHGGAQYGLGEATAIALATMLFHDRQRRLNALTAQAAIVYHRRAGGSLLAHAAMPAAEATRLRATLDEQGKVRFLALVEIADETRSLATSLTVECVVMVSQ